VVHSFTITLRSNSDTPHSVRFLWTSDRSEGDSELFPLVQFHKLHISHSFLDYAKCNIRQPKTPERKYSIKMGRIYSEIRKTTSRIWVYTVPTIPCSRVSDCSVGLVSAWEGM